MMDAKLKSALQARLAEVDSRLEAACRRGGRERRDVTLVAVTKTVAADIADLLPELGVLDLGENRPQELWKKERTLNHAVRWHLIGHLQTNKIARTLPLVYMIHSVDSSHLLRALEAEAQKQERAVPVLLEVNAGREPQKHGFMPEEVAGLPEQITGLKFIQVRGLMAMAPLEADPEQCRPVFAELRRLRDRLREQLVPPHAAEHLSMGMSNDFEVAVEEGATLVRLGSVLFANLGAAS